MRQQNIINYLRNIKYFPWNRSSSDIENNRTKKNIKFKNLSK